MGEEEALTQLVLKAGHRVTVGSWAASGDEGNLRSGQAQSMETKSLKDMKIYVLNLEISIHF